MLPSQPSKFLPLNRFTGFSLAGNLTDEDQSSAREAETAAQWMRHHPDITVVSRDRGSEYAKAAMLGAPQATQCADRFHIVKNLTEATQLILARSQEEIAAASKSEESCQHSSTKRVISVEEWRGIRASPCGESAAGQTSGAPHAL